MRHVLLELAEDLSREIMMEWLEPADVARLDIAYNNRALSRVHRSLLCSPLTLFDVSHSKKEEKLRWAMKRRLNLGSIRLNEYPRVPEDVWTSIALTSCSCLGQTHSGRAMKRRLHLLSTTMVRRRTGDNFFPKCQVVTSTG